MFFLFLPPGHVFFCFSHMDMFLFSFSHLDMFFVCFSHLDMFLFCFSLITFPNLAAAIPLPSSSHSALRILTWWPVPSCGSENIGTKWKMTLEETASRMSWKFLRCWKGNFTINDVCHFLCSHNKDEFNSNLIDHTSLRQARMPPAVMPAIHSKAKAASIAMETTASKSGFRKGKLVVCRMRSWDQRMIL